MGPKRQPGTAANLVAGQAAGPLEMPGASQDCPQLYQGESGGLEPAMKPMAGQAAAPGAEGLLRKARPFGAGRPSRGDQSPHVPPSLPSVGNVS